MNINFIGTGMKKNYEDDFIYLISNDIKKRLKDINQNFDFEFDYDYLSSRIHDFEDEENDEAIYAGTCINKENISIDIDIKKFTYEDNKINVFVDINFIERDEQGEFSENENEKENLFDELIYDVKVCVSKAVSKYTNEVNWIRDEQNEKISQQLYMKVHNIENKFRGIINEYMLKKFGEDWFTTKITDEFNKKSEDFSGWYNDRYKTLRYIKSEIFNLQTNDLIMMLKNSYEDEKVTKVMKQINNIKSLLGNKTNEIINENILNDKDLWTKYFIDIFTPETEVKWEEFAKMRNMIAHNKVISKEFYIDMINSISELDKIFDMASKKLNSKLKSLEEKMINDYIKSCDLDWILESIDFKQYQDDEDVIEDIFADGELGSLYDIIEEKVKSLVEVYEEFKISLEEIYLDVEEEDIDEKSDFINEFAEKLLVINKIVNYNDADIIELLIRKTDNVSELNSVGNYLSKLKYELIEKLEVYIENTKWDDEFRDKLEICKFYNLNNDIFSVKINGWFCIDFGSGDEIFIIYARNEEEIERGGIDISFGDYTEHDGGYVMPEQDQYIRVNVENLYNAIENDADEVITSIQSFVEEMSTYL